MMAQHTFESLHRALKNGELAPVYYFYGPEDILKDETVQSILEKALDPSLREFNYDQRSVTQLDPESLHSLLNTLPMMADRRVVVLRDIEGFKRKPKVRAVLDDYLKRPAPDTLLILHQSSGEPKGDPSIARGTVDIEFATLSPERAVRWINHCARKQGVELAPEAATHLFDSVGNDLGTLRMEIAKLASLVTEGPVSIEQVASMVGVRRGETLLSWRDLVMEGSVGKALPMVGAVLEQSGMSGVKMISALGTAIIGMGLTRPHIDRGLKGRALQERMLKTLLSVRPFGLGDWKAESEKWSRWAPSWPMSRVRDGLRAVLDADRALKNTRISDERGLVIDLVLRLTSDRWGEAA